MSVVWSAAQIDTPLSFSSEKSIRQVQIKFHVHMFGPGVKYWIMRKSHDAKIVMVIDRTNNWLL